MRTQADILLKELVDALDKAFISTWQSTAYWDGELDAAKEYLADLDIKDATP